MEGDRIRIRKILRRAERENRLDQVRAQLWRPVCWVVGHRPVFKMDLRGKGMCTRCPVLVPAQKFLDDAPSGR